MSFALRAANAADYPVVARLFLELRVADPVPSAEHYASRMLPRVVVLEHEGDVRGYAHWQLYGRTAHLVHLVVDPRARGLGAGLALMQEVAQRVRAGGCARWYLNVKKDNVPAIALYQGCGLRFELEVWATRIAWSQLATLREAPSGAVAYTPDRTDDEGIAASLGVEPERLALLRLRQDIVLLGLREADAPVGFAAFDPAYPGVHPIRLARPDLARSVFDALRPSARHEHVHVTVEEDRALIGRLRVAGAEVLHEVFRMSATLP